MKKTLIYTTIIITILGGTFIGFVASMIDTPYEYTQKYGNEETKKLYAAYKMAREIVPFKDVLEYLRKNNIEYIEYKEEGLISLHGDTEGHAETVLIWHKNGKTIGARFDEFL